MVCLARTGIVRASVASFVVLAKRSCCADAQGIAQRDNTATNNDLIMDRFFPGLAAKRHRLGELFWPAMSANDGFARGAAHR